MSKHAPTDAELEQFEDFAASPPMEDYAMDASTLQGMAAALAIGPRVISPSIWLPWVWDMHRGQRPPAFATLDEANTIVALVMRQYNTVVTAFESEPVDFDPLFASEAQWGAAEFCQGFLSGVRLAQADWAPLEATDPEVLASIRSVAGTSSDAIGGIEGGEFDALIADIVPTLHAIHGFWLGGRDGGALSQPDTWQRVRMGLKWLRRPFPAAAVALAEAHRDEVAPHLVQVLSAIAEDPTVALDGEYTLHLFAMHLLAGWRDRRAFAPLLALGQHHDPDVIESLFGELVHDSYSRCLASVSGGDIAPMIALADDPLADVWVRAAVLEGLTACVLEGEADRGHVVAYLHAAAEREATALRAGRSSGACSFELIESIVSELTDLCAVDSLPAIRKWFAEGLLDPNSADLDFIEEHIAEPPEQASASLLERKRGYVAGAATEMAWWYMFDPISRWSETGSIVGDASSSAASVPARPYTGQERAPQLPIVRAEPKVGRNDPCPCGSGRKYKKCHGAN